MSNVGVLTHTKTDKAIKLTEQDVIELRRNKVKNLPCNSKIWSLKYGFETLAMSNILTNIIINSHFRSQFRLQNTSLLAALSSHSLVSLIPPVAAATFSSAYFGVFLYKFSNDECFTCRELKTIGLHMTIGSVMPTAVSWICSFLHADLFKTYGVPKTQVLFESNISKKLFFKQSVDVWKKTTKNSFKVLTFNYSIQIILCSFIMFMQEKQFLEEILPLNFSLNEINKIKL